MIPIITRTPSGTWTVFHRVIQSVAEVWDTCWQLVSRCQSLIYGAVEEQHVILGAHVRIS